MLWDRAAGVLLGLACGDALRPGNDTPGEYSATTGLAVAITQIAATGVEFACTGVFPHVGPALGGGVPTFQLLIVQGRPAQQLTP